ncbi:MAG: sigma-70 family RNA polymerase sigma factor [Chitinivibrionales bacterium]|nr:sigma-70 family RNA polymerase sigma factor [Chitinivibrionales bacterium]
MREGDREAVSALVAANLRFVVNVARAYQHQGLPLADLINEGNIGMIRAALRFDERKNFRFITYAVWWVRQSILKALAENSRVVKLPLNRVGTLYKITKAQARMEQKLARSPNADELAQELDMRTVDVAKTLQAGNTALSLDSPVQDEDSSCLGDCLQSNVEDLPDEVTMRRTAHEQLQRALRSLDERERRVISMYYGMDGQEPYSLEEIGKRLGLTRERARQLKQRALMTLRHMAPHARPPAGVR